MLEGLALRHASGALRIEGSPSGTIYLDQGHISFARTTWSPDLGTRLAGVLADAGSLRDLLLAADQPDADAGEQLTGRGLITRDQLSATLESVVVDAVIALTVPLAAAASVTDIRLETPRPHWAAAFCHVRVDAARARAMAWAQRLAACEVPRAARLELRDMTHSRAVLTRLQWVVARHINGALTTRDLAWQCGLALCDTVEAVDALARAGLCGPVPADLPAPAEAGPPLPRRRPADGPPPVPSARPGQLPEPEQARETKQEQAREQEAAREQKPDRQTEPGREQEPGGQTEPGRQTDRRREQEPGGQTEPGRQTDRRREQEPGRQTDKGRQTEKTRETEQGREQEPAAATEQAAATARAARLATAAEPGQASPRLPGPPLPAPTADDPASASDPRVVPPLESLRRVLEGLRQLN